jgi:hypothetical protein
MKKHNTEDTFKAHVYRIVQYNKEAIRTSHPVPPRKNIYSEYKCRSKNRGIEFSMAKEPFMEILQRSCEYCGSHEHMGIDRIDSALGYTIENTVP